MLLVAGKASLVLAAAAAAAGTANVKPGTRPKNNKFCVRVHERGQYLEKRGEYTYVCMCVLFCLLILIVII